MKTLKVLALVLLSAPFAAHGMQVVGDLGAVAGPVGGGVGAVKGASNLWRRSPLRLMRESGTYRAAGTAWHYVAGGANNMRRNPRGWADRNLSLKSVLVTVSCGVLLVALIDTLKKNYNQDYEDNPENPTPEQAQAQQDAKDLAALRDWDRIQARRAEFIQRGELPR